jgi:uncharacterized protein (DUF2249 family)
MTKHAKERFCYNCGESMGVYADHDPHDTCGKLECNRAVRDDLQAERDEAHEQLYRDMGW